MQQPSNFHHWRKLCPRLTVRQAVQLTMLEDKLDDSFHLFFRRHLVPVFHAEVPDHLGQPGQYLGERLAVPVLLHHVEQPVPERGKDGRAEQFLHIVSLLPLIAEEKVDRYSRV